MFALLFSTSSSAASTSSKDLNIEHKDNKDKNSGSQEKQKIDEYFTPFNERNVNLYMPLFDFQKPEKFEKQYSKENRIKSMIDPKKVSNNELLKDSYIIQSNTTEFQMVEKLYDREVISQLIFKETNKVDIPIPKEHKNVYVFPNTTYIQDKLTDNLKGVNLKEFYKISNKIKFSKTEPIFIEKPICIPGVQIFSIHAVKEELTITNVYTDIYQVSVFIYTKKATKANSPDQLFPQTVTSSKALVLQIVTLADFEGTTYGNMFINLIDGSIIVVPITLNAVANHYNIKPIYETKLVGSKILNVPINIRNPHTETLIVKEVIHSFNSINLIWPNGQVLSTSNTTNISPEMMEVTPDTEKTIINIYFYKEVSNLEYGLIHFKTDKDTIIVPVLIKVEIKGIGILPNYFNFGMIDIGNNSYESISKVKRVIPVHISNVVGQEVKLETIFIEMEDAMIEFVLNEEYSICNLHKQEEGKGLEKNKKSRSKNFNNETENLVSSYTPKPVIFKTDSQKVQLSNNCIIPKNADNVLLGYFVLDPQNFYKETAPQDFTFNSINRKMKGNILIQTNFAPSPIISIPYEYKLSAQVFKPLENSMEFNIKKLEEEILYPISFISNLENLTVIEDFGHLIKLTLNLITRSTEHDKPVITYNYSMQILNQKAIRNLKSLLIKAVTPDNMVTLIPIKFYDTDLKFIYCGIISSIIDCLNTEYEYLKGVNHNNQRFMIDIGSIADSEIETRYFFFLNETPEKILIKDFNSNSKHVKVAINNVESLEEKKQFLYSNTSNQKYILEQSQKEVNSEVQVKLMKETLVRFSLDMTRSDSDFYGLVSFKFTEKVSLNINVKAKFVRGTLSLIPNLVRFDSAFPGLFQSKLISAKSSFGNNVIIKKIESDDHRIQVSVLNNVISNTNRTEIIKVDFDPSKVHWEENFMRGNFTLNMSPLKYLTYKELYWWKQKQRSWEMLGSQGKTEIKANIHIRTDIKNDFIQVTGSLNKPPLVKKDEIDFKLNQIGEQITRFIEVVNESDEYMSIQIILAPDEYREINNYSMYEENKKITMSSNKHLMVLDCLNLNSEFNPTSTDFLKNRKDSQANTKQKAAEKKKAMNYKVIVDDEMTNHNLHFFSKEDIVRKMFKYSDGITKTGIIMNQRLACNTDFLNKNEVVFKNDNELIGKIFSEEFDNEIPVIVKMTERTIKKKKEASQAALDSMGLIELIAYYIKMIFIMTDEVEENAINGANKNKNTHPPLAESINNSNSTSFKHDFYLPKSLTNQIFSIKPHQKTKIGPIIYFPADFQQSKATLFIKNNLTILYPIQLKGSGGSGVLEFFEERRKYGDSLIEKAEDYQYIGDYETEIIQEKIYNDRLMINIDKDYLGSPLQVNKDYEIQKTIIMKNTGTLPVKIGKISVENMDCESYGIKVLDCMMHTLKPGEAKKLDILIKPDFNFYYIEKEIVFMTPHKNISLKVCVNISNDLLSDRNGLFNLGNLFEENLSLVLLVGVIIAIIIHVTLKEQSEYRNKGKSQIEIINYKELLRNNPQLQYEYLYIKAYRKQNLEGFTEFFTEQMDKPGTYDADIEIPVIKEKRKTKYKKDNIYSASNKNKYTAQVDSKDKNDEEARPAQTEKAHANEVYKSIIREYGRDNKNDMYNNSNTISTKTKDKETKERPIGSTKTKKHEINVDGKKNIPLHSTGSGNVGSNNPPASNANTANDNSIYSSTYGKKAKTITSNIKETSDTGAAAQVESSNKYNKKHSRNLSVKEDNKSDKEKSFTKEAASKADNKVSQNNPSKSSKSNNTGSSNNPSIYNTQEALSESELIKVINNSKPYIPKNIPAESNPLPNAITGNSAQDPSSIKHSKSPSPKDIGYDPESQWNNTKYNISIQNSTADNAKIQKEAYPSDKGLPEITEEKPDESNVLNEYKELSKKHQEQISENKGKPNFEGGNFNKGDLFVRRGTEYLGTEEDIEVDDAQKNLFLGNLDLDIDDGDEIQKTERKNTRKYSTPHNKGSFDNKIPENSNVNTSSFNKDKNTDGKESRKMSKEIKSNRKRSQVSQSNNSEINPLDDKRESISKINKDNIPVETSEHDTDTRNKMNQKYQDELKESERQQLESTPQSDSKNISNMKFKFAAFNKPMFNKANAHPQETSQPKPHLNRKPDPNKSEENDSEDDKENSSHYLSEFNQLPLESGNEDFSRQFNFNNIFGSNSNNNMKMGSYGMENETETEEKNDDFLYKGFPAFKQENVYSGFGTFSLNPFSNDNEDEGKQSDLLGDLRDESDHDHEHPRNYEEKLDDVIEDDEEEDPEWAEEDMTIKKEGFFDVKGDYKLKQTDFNFDLDKRYNNNKSKK